MDEEHLEMAIEQDVDLLPLALIYAPKEVQVARQLAGRMYSGRGIYENKITLENSLKWLKEQSERRHKGYYNVIVNLPKPEPGSEGSNPAAPVMKEKVIAEAEAYPPPGADMKRVTWFWSNVQRLTRFVFTGEVPAESKKWGVEHLRWLAQQQKGGKTELSELLEEAQKEAEERKQD